MGVGVGVGVGVGEEVIFALHVLRWLFCLPLLHFDKTCTF
jgi:hypothetical protein